jgi:hypothetical protein
MIPTLIFQFEVESILYQNLEKGIKKYLVKWNHFSIKECTWEPESNISTAKECLQVFKESPPDVSKRIVRILTKF